MTPVRLLRAALAAAVLSACAGAALAADPPDLSGTWSPHRFIGTIRTLKGRTPPLRPEALALYRRRMADRAAGKPVGDPIDTCLPHGIPRLMYAPYPMVILQQPDQISIVQQANHTQRLIYIGADLPQDGDPKWLGDAVARWEGRTLVVSTIDQNDRTWLDKAGLPHSDQLKVTERLTLAGKATLRDVITIDDPKTYTAPWTTALIFDRRPGIRLQEAICTRDHRM